MLNKVAKLLPFRGLAKKKWAVEAFCFFNTLLFCLILVKALAKPSGYLVVKAPARVGIKSSTESDPYRDSDKSVSG